jgi:general secretion pathway protein F
MTSGTASWFEIVAIAPHGEVRNARVCASSSEEATRHAQLDGLRVLNIRPATAPGWGGLLFARSASAAGARSRLDVAQFAHELAALLDAGLGMVDALGTLGAKETVGAQRLAYAQLARTVTEGLPLSEALARQPERFPELLVAAVAAAEHTGDLAAALRHFAENQAALRVLRSRFIGAAIYPAILLGVAAVVVMFLLGVVVPKFALLIESTPRDVPLASRLLLKWGTTLAAHPWLFAGGAVALLAAAVFGFVHGQRSGWRLTGLQRLWVIGPLIRIFRQAQFFRTTSMLVGGGIPALRALTMCGALLTPEDQRALQGALASISEGQPIGDAMAASGIADVVAQRMLEVASRTGKLADTLGRIATFQEGHLARSLDVAARLIEPALMIFIGLVIGGIVVLMYMPIFELASGLQ